MKPPESISPHYELFPAELRARPVWLVWKYELNSRKSDWTKVPHIADPCGGGAKSNDPSTWRSFEQAVHMGQKASGIGLCFVEDYCGIDLDCCRDKGTGVIAPWAQKIVNHLNSYTELSPSGEGLHIIVRLTQELPKGGRKWGGKEKGWEIGVYDRTSPRYFCATGRIIQDRAQIRTCDPGELYPQFVAGEFAPDWARAKPPEPATSKPNGHGAIDKKQALLRGEWEGLYPSQSEADAALVWYLAKEFGNDPAAIDRAFRNSCLMRPKWDQARSGGTYGSLLIAKIAGTVSDAQKSSATSDWRELFHTYDETLSAPPLKFAIQGFLQQDAITLIGALAGHGKTMVMLNMVKVLIEGGKLFNYHPFEVKEPSKRVIYCIPECGLAPFVHRLKLFRLMNHVRDQKLFFRTLNARTPLKSLADPRMLKAAEGADVFLDTAIRFMEGDENSASDQRMFAQTLFNLQEAGARTIVGAHHSPKNLGHANFLTLENVLRGSGDLGAMIATCWGVFQQDSKTNKLVVKNVKPRDFEPCSEFSIQGRPYLLEEGFFQIIDMPGEMPEFNPQQDRGKKGGRPETEYKGEKLAEARRLMDADKTAEEAAIAVGVSRATLFRWMGGQ